MGDPKPSKFHLIAQSELPGRKLSIVLPADLKDIPDPLDEKINCGGSNEKIVHIFQEPWTIPQAWVRKDQEKVT